MIEENANASRRLARFIPQAGVRIQLVLAALMWLIGASILLVRGLGYVHDRYWHAWALAAGLAIGVVKSKALLEGVARRAVARIHLRGTGQLLGFFSLRSWLLIGAMMGGGIILRNIFVHPGVIGAGILGAIYIGVGTALLLADRVFWRAVIQRGAAERRAQPRTESL